MALDFSQGGYEHLFRDALLQGINLFCGAGFSVDAVDHKDSKLPVGADLLTELKSIFPIVKDYSNLPRACTKITKTDKQSFYSFLKSRFSVKDFDPAYMSLSNTIGSLTEFVLLAFGLIILLIIIMTALSKK